MEGVSAKRLVDHDRLKGESHVVDGCYAIDASVAVGADEQLHDGRVYSPPAGGSLCHGAGGHHSKTANGTREGQAVAHASLQRSDPRRKG